MAQAAAPTVRGLTSVRTVLHLIDLPGPGGAETIYVAVAAGLDRSRFRSVAAAPDRGWTFDALRAAGLDPIVTPIKRGPLDWRYLRQIVGLVRRERVDLVHAHLLGPSVYAGMAGLLTGVPIVATFHGHVDVSAGERLLRLKTAILNRACSRITFVSEALRVEFLRRTALRAQRTAVVVNGIDDPADAVPEPHLRGVLGAQPGQFLVGAVGHIRPPKAYDVFLRAAALLLERSPSYRFVIVGQVERKDVYDDLVGLRDSLGLRDRVLFAGRRDDVPQVLRAFDAYVVSSTSEGFSLSTVQAMRAGIPVVATRCGGPETILEDGTTGILVACSDPHALADGVDRLRRDPALRARLANAARAAADGRYTAAAMVAGYERVYDETLGTAR